MSNVIDAEWGSVMDAYRKGNIMRLAWVKKKKEQELKAVEEQELTERKRYQDVFGATGEKSTCEEIQEIFKSGGFIIDVRNPVEYKSGGKIHNSVNVPIDGLVEWCNINERINSNTPILVYSNNGKSAETALRILKDDYDYVNVTNIGTHKWYTFCS